MELTVSFVQENIRWKRRRWRHFCFRTVLFVAVASRASGSAVSRIRQSRFTCLYLENRFATNVSKLNARIRLGEIKDQWSAFDWLHYIRQPTLPVPKLSPRRWKLWALCFPLNESMALSSGLHIVLTENCCEKIWPWWTNFLLTTNVLEYVLTMCFSQSNSECPTQLG